MALILAVASQACAKASVTFFIITLSPHRRILVLCRCVLGIIVLWVVTAVPALAAQCNSPMPWVVAPGRCVDEKALYIYIGAINVLTDAALIVLPIYLLTLVSIGGRWTVMALFSIRSMYVLSTVKKAGANLPLNILELSFSKYFQSCPYPRSSRRLPI